MKFDSSFQNNEGKQIKIDQNDILALKHLHRRWGQKQLKLPTACFALSEGEWSAVAKPLFPNELLVRMQYIFSMATDRC